MKSINQIILVVFLAFFVTAQAQIGLNTTAPDASSIMDLKSNNRGLLAPRMTTMERDKIENPAIGLLIYNVTTSMFNYFDSSWKDLSDDYKSVTATNLIRTYSTSEEVIPGMTLAPDAGTYLFSFNTQYTNTSTTSSRSTELWR